MPDFRMTSVGAKEIKRIVVHKDCPDGIASAMILKNALHEERAYGAEIEFVQYSTPEHRDMVAEPGMLFCDFAPHHTRTQDFLDAGSIVLDHHKSQKEVVMQFVESGRGAFADEDERPGVSGALLAYECVWDPLNPSPGERMAPPNRAAVHKLARLAGIRDTWQTQAPEWKAACEQAEAMRFWGPERLLTVPPQGWGVKLKAVGERALERRLELASMCLSDAYRFTTPKGARVVLFQGVHAVSDAAEEIDKDADVVVGFLLHMLDGEPDLIYSLRSHTDFDCAAFARAMSPGGGGHSRAAGFGLEIGLHAANPFGLFRDLLIEYEEKNGNPEGD